MNGKREDLRCDTAPGARLTEPPSLCTLTRTPVVHDAFLLRGHHGPACSIAMLHGGWIDCGGRCGDGGGTGAAWLASGRPTQGSHTDVPSTPHWPIAHGRRGYDRHQSTTTVFDTGRAVSHSTQLHGDMLSSGRDVIVIGVVRQPSHPAFPAPAELGDPRWVAPAQEYPQAVLRDASECGGGTPLPHRWTLHDAPAK